MPEPTSQAKYTLQIPRYDNNGNELKDLAKAAHDKLHSRGQILGSRMVPMRGFFEDNPEEQFEAMEAYTHDTPEMDSHMKQLAQEVAQMGQQWGMFMTKEGGGNVNSWVVQNPTFQPGASAPEVAQKGIPLPQNTTPYGEGGATTQTQQPSPIENAELR